MDQRQRELERRALQGDAEAETQLLLQRVRAGELSGERWRLAAHLGHLGACGAQGIQPFATRSARKLKRWFKEISTYGCEASVRAALALPSPTVKLRAERSQQALDGLERWLLDPDPARIAGLPSFRWGKETDRPYRLALRVAVVG